MPTVFESKVLFDWYTLLIGSKIPQASALVVVFFLIDAVPLIVIILIIKEEENVKM